MRPAPSCDLRTPGTVDHSRTGSAPGDDPLPPWSTGRAGSGLLKHTKTSSTPAGGAAHTPALYNFTSRWIFELGRRRSVLSTLKTKAKFLH